MSSVLIEFHVFSRIFCGFFIKFLLIFLKLFYRFSLIFTTRIQEGSTWFAPVAARVNEITDVVGGWSRVLACILHRMFLGPNGFSTAGCAFTHEGALCIYIYIIISIYTYVILPRPVASQSCGHAVIPRNSHLKEWRRGDHARVVAIVVAMHNYSSQKKLDQFPALIPRRWIIMESMQDCLRQESTRMCSGKAISLT